MQLSKATIVAVATFLVKTAFAESNSTIAEEFESLEGAEGSVNGTDFPFSDDAILEAVALPEDVIPLVTDDTVFFVNATIAQQEIIAAQESQSSSFSKRDAIAEAKADAAWYWHTYSLGQPFSKRDAGADADASWYWHKYSLGQPFSKRDAGADADASWYWHKYSLGQPFSKRDAGADADASWYWHTYSLGQPFSKRDAGADADASWYWHKYSLGQPFSKRDAGADADASWYWHKYSLGQPFSK